MFFANPEGRWRRRGVVAIFIAVSLTLIVGVVAIAVDGGMLFLELRRARAVADASAMAAAAELFEHYPSDRGTDPNGGARRAAFRVAKLNGYPVGGETTVTVNIPPASGTYQGRTDFAEVIVTKQVQRTFGLLWGDEPIPVTARAVARGSWIQANAGVLILDYDDRASLTAQGNGALTETGGPVIVNSSNASALVSTGNGSLSAQEFYVTGGAQISGGANVTTAPIPGQVFTGVHPTPDPLAYLPVPSIPPDGTIRVTALGGGAKRYLLTPGRHTNLPTFTVNDEVVLQQASAGNGGIYYLDGGGFRSSGATVRMDPSTSGGLMLYNAPRNINDKIQITGNPDGAVDLKPLTDGPYQGMVLWQDRTRDVPVEIEGNGDFAIRGTFYAASALMKITGNGKTVTGEETGSYVDDQGNTVSGASLIGSQYITRNLMIAGNGNITINYRAGQVARTRIIALVE